MTHNSHQINTPNLYNHNESTQSRINPFNNYTITNNTNPLYSNRLYENKSKIISNKIKMRKLIFDNIATKGGKEKNLDSSISD